MTVKELVLVLVLADNVIVGGEVCERDVPVFGRWSAVCDQLLIGFLKGGVNGGRLCVS